jgi:hypothetical protein
VPGGRKARDQDEAELSFDRSHSDRAELEFGAPRQPESVVEWPRQRPISTQRRATARSRRGGFEPARQSSSN